MHGGVKFYRGSAVAARTYVEADRSRADDYYLAEGTGLASHYVAERSAVNPGQAPRLSPVGELDGDGYERWVAGYDTDGRARGRLRTDEHGLRFVEVVVNGPKTWSLAAALHPVVSDAYDAAQDRAAEEIVGWLAEHSTTRVGPRGRQVQVPVDRLEAAVVRHHTSRAGDPHRHLHLQINARVQVLENGAWRWRGLHSIGVVDSIEAINGIGHAAVMCDPQFRAALAAHGYTLDPATGEVRELVPYSGAFSARAKQIGRNLDRYEASWRTEHPGAEPGRSLRRSWDRRAWADARPDKVIPADGEDVRLSWLDELHDLGFDAPTTSVALNAVAVGRLNRDAAVELALTRLGAKRSSWNAADIRGGCERIVASVDIVTTPAVRRELVEDLTARAIAACVPLLPDRDDVPEHVRGLTSPAVVQVEADLTSRLTTRAFEPAKPVPLALLERPLAHHWLDDTQRTVVAVLAGTGPLVVVEGAAGAGKTTTLAAARDALEFYDRRLVVVTPTLKAAQVAGEQLGTPASSAAWFAHQHGYRWDEDGYRHRVPVARADVAYEARLLPGDMLLIDEAGMLDQDTALALLAIADENHTRVAFVGDRHQLPAVGRGGVLDHAARWAPDTAQVELDTVHRFVDPDYAALTLLMRSGERPGEVFDQLLERGEVVLHATDVERTAALTQADGMVIADTREQAADLNAAIRDHRRATAADASPSVATTAGVPIGVGDQIATRRNDRDLGVANRDTWTVTHVDDHGGLQVTGRNGRRSLPSTYVREHVELAYAFTVHGAQGETVDQAHLLLGETTGAAAAYVAMTRGRRHNTAHLVAETLEQARNQWIETFSRDRADLGPAHAAARAAADIDRYGPQPTPPSYAPTTATQRAAPADAFGPRESRREPSWPRADAARAHPGTGR